MKKLISIFALSLLLTACVFVKPSDETIINAVIASKSQPELLKVVSAQKVNGWEDGEFYVAEVEYILEFQKGIAEVQSQLTDQVQRDFFGTLINGLGSAALAVEYGSFKRGDQFGKKETFKFRKTEQGWMLAQ